MNKIVVLTSSSLFFCLLMANGCEEGPEGADVDISVDTVIFEPEYDYIEGYDISPYFTYSIDDSFAECDIDFSPVNQGIVRSLILRLRPAV